MTENQTDIAERIRARERTAHAEPTEVPERMASLFVYVEPLTGPDKGNGDVKWYLEGDRGLVAESVARLVRDGEPLLVLTGRKVTTG